MQKCVYFVDITYTMYDMQNSNQVTEPSLSWVMVVGFKTTYAISAYHH